MYETDLTSSTEVRTAKHAVIWLVALVAVVSVVAWFATRTVQVADNAVIRYEEFQEIYNTCQQLNTDLGTLRAIDEHDPMFSQFSKAAVIAAKKQKLARWVEDYNAKSKMWNRALWKSSALPYQLGVEDFANYGGAK